MTAIAEMDDEFLIGYCDLHCESERALFNSEQINRMLALAGHPDGFVRAVPAGRWMSVHGEMKELCRLARERLKSQKSSTVEPASLPSNVLPFHRRGK